MFYSERHQAPISTYWVKRKFGINPDNDPGAAMRVGVYPLTEAPEGYSPTHYVKEAGTYTAVPHEFSDDEREAVYRIQAIGTAAREFVSDCIPDWDAATSYLTGSFVEHNGSLWRAASASTGAEPSIPEDPEEVNEDWTFIR